MTPSRSTSKAAKASVGTLEFTNHEDYSQDDTVTKAKSAKVFSASSTPSRNWNVDSGCSLSMTPFALSLSHLHPFKKLIQLADLSFISASHSGSTVLMMTGDDHLHPALLVPSLHKPLLSVLSLCDDGLVVVFNKSSCSFYCSDDVALPMSPVSQGY